MASAFVVAYEEYLKGNLLEANVEGMLRNRSVSRVVPNLFYIGFCFLCSLLGKFENAHLESLRLKLDENMKHWPQSGISMN
jgi:hypothetical protein